MDIQEIKAKKMELESNIQKLIVDFSRETELSILNIDLSRVKDVSGRISQYNVGIDILI